jgi:hypothetical protein
VERRLFDGEGSFPIIAPGRKLRLYSKITKRGIFARTFDQDSASNVEEQLVDDYVAPFGGIYPVEDGIPSISLQRPRPSNWGCPFLPIEGV